MPSVANPQVRLDNSWHRAQGSSSCAFKELQKKTIEIMDKRINKVIDTHILTPGNNSDYIHNHCNSWKVNLNQTRIMHRYKTWKPRRKGSTSFLDNGSPQLQNKPKHPSNHVKIKACGPNAQKIVKQIMLLSSKSPFVDDVPLPCLIARRQTNINVENP